MKQKWMTMLLLVSAAPLCYGSSEKNQTRQFIETIFLSACSHAPDPASLDYYEKILEDRTETPERVHDEIVASCAPQNDACHHVRGLERFCAPAKK